MATNVLLPSGLEVILSAFDHPRWSENYVGGIRGWFLDESLIRAALRDRRGLFRVWSIPNRQEHAQAYSSLVWPMLPESRTSATTVEQYNRIAQDCEPPSMPYVMVYPVPIELIDNDGTLAIRLGVFDTVRTVHMSEVERSGDHPSPLGYSIGRWDGRELVVETTNIKTPYSSTIGMAQSEGMRVVERFSLREEVKSPICCKYDDGMRWLPLTSIAA